VVYKLGCTELDVQYIRALWTSIRSTHPSGSRYDAPPDGSFQNVEMDDLGCGARHATDEES
jgi:hypothetical protein